MDWNILIVIGSLTLVLWWLVKPFRDSLGTIKEEIGELRKDVKQNGERIARIEGVIWTDIDKARRK